MPVLDTMVLGVLEQLSISMLIMTNMLETAFAQNSSFYSELLGVLYANQSRDIQFQDKVIKELVDSNVMVDDIHLVTGDIRDGIYHIRSDLRRNTDLVQFIHQRDETRPTATLFDPSYVMPLVPYRGGTASQLLPPRQ